MRTLASICAVTLLAATTPRAFAGKCYVDSDCPTGMVCNDAGGCEVPSGNGGGGTSGGGSQSSTKLVLYSVILAVVIIAILVPAMQATEDAQSGARHAAFPPTCEDDPPAPVGGFTLRF